MDNAVTIQYEQVIARRGTLTTTVKERRFKSEAAMSRWAERATDAGKIGQILRYSYSQQVQA